MHVTAEKLQRMYTSVATLAGQVELLKKTMKEKDTKYAEVLMSLRRMLDEKDRLHHANTEEKRRMQECYIRCLQENKQLKLELQSQKKYLGRCMAQNRLEQKKLNVENEKLNAEGNSSLDNPVRRDNTLEFQIKLDKLRKEPDAKTDGMQDMESLNQTPLVTVQMIVHALEEACKELISVKTKLFEKEGELISLRKHLDEKTDDMQAMESLNQTLLVKERMTTDELQKVRTGLISGLSGFPPRSNIGIKRMGEMDLKQFQCACMEKIPGEDWGMKSVELCSLWQNKIQDARWHPFKRIRIKGEFGEQEQEVVDADDEKLKELKDAWGEQVYKAVSVALSELNEYNPSGRYAVPELWNFKEGRNSSLEEVIEYVVNKLKTFKTRTKTLNRRG